MVEIEKLGLILLMTILTTTAIPYTQCPYIRSIAKFQFNSYVVYKENSFTAWLTKNIVRGIIFNTNVWRPHIFKRDQSKLASLPFRFGSYEKNFCRSLEFKASLVSWVFGSILP